MDALTLYRLGNWFYRHHIPVMPGLMQLLVLVLFSSYIPYQVIIGSKTKVGHRGIGNNVLIRAHVTIGKKEPTGMAPVIEDDVEIGDGAKILGNVRIGKAAIIGANAVVTKDVPSQAIALGVPAKIVRRDS